MHDMTEVHSSNNIAKYEAVLLGLHKLRVMGVQYCTLKTYSKVVASQIEKECMARDATLERYLVVVRRIENYFKGFAVEYIERMKNTEIDKLAKAAVKKVVLPPNVFFQVIEDPSVKTVEPEPRMVNIIEEDIPTNESGNGSTDPN
jgi:ribonuclease HI